MAMLFGIAEAFRGNQRNGCFVWTVASGLFCIRTVSYQDRFVSGLFRIRTVLYQGCFVSGPFCIRTAYQGIALAMP
jgi:hypothetical protein